MKPALLGTRAAAATVAVGLGVALASSATPIAVADPSNDDGSSSATATTSSPTRSPGTSRSTANDTDTDAAGSADDDTADGDSETETETETDEDTTDLDTETETETDEDTTDLDTETDTETDEDTTDLDTETDAPDEPQSGVDTAAVSGSEQAASGRGHAPDADTVTETPAAPSAEPEPETEETEDAGVSSESEATVDASASSTPGQGQPGSRPTATVDAVQIAEQTPAQTASTTTAPPGPLATLLALPGAIMDATSGVVASVLTSLATPLTNTFGSPMEWLAAAAARREVGDADTRAELINAVQYPVINEVGERIELAVATLLAPVTQLFVDLGLMASPRDDGWLGECVDGYCVSSTDIPVPQPEVGVTFLNLTGTALTLTNLDSYEPLAYGPHDGFVLESGQQVEMGIYKDNDEDTSIRATMDWGNGTTRADVTVLFNGVSATTTSDSMQVDVFNTPTPVTGASVIPVRQTLVFLPQAGTTITIPTSDPVAQSVVAMTMCGNRGTCDQEAISSEVKYTESKNVGNTVFNYGTETSANTYEVSHQTTKTSGIDESLKVLAGGGLNFTLGPLTFQGEINAILQAKFGHTWTEGILVKQGATVNVAPGKYGQIQLSYAEYHDTVDMTIVDKGVTIEIPGVVYVSAVPEGTVDENGNPVGPPIWTTIDYDIGTGPDPNPNSTSDPNPPTYASPPADTPTPADIDEPTEASGPAPMPLGAALVKYVVAQTEAILRLPSVVLGGGSSRAGGTKGFQIVNLTPYPQKLIALSGEVEDEDNPAVGYILQPYQMVRGEVDYDLFGGGQSTWQWQRNDGVATTVSEAQLVTFGDGGSAVRCQNSACMDGGRNEAQEADIYYIINPSPSTVDLTANTNLASVAVDAACYYTASGATPGSCSANVTGQSYFTDRVGDPSQYNYNQASTTANFTYTVTTIKSETTSWAVGGGLKIKEKSGLFLVQQLEAESITLYTGKTQEKDTESTTVKQNVPSGSTGTLSVGDVNLRTYGDFIINLPNSTLIVRDQWLENSSGLATLGPVVSLTDYPGPPNL